MTAPHPRPGTAIGSDLHALGWDVRGWRSTDQATAVACLREGEQTIEWLGVSAPFGLAEDSRPDFCALAEPAVGHEVERVAKAARIAVAIDAPLALPTPFVDLVSGRIAAPRVPRREIDNPLAYRDCERWIHQQFGKKPLSAPFDKLGNNASLALAACRALAHDGFALVPQERMFAARAVIEVYPGLAKTGARKLDCALPAIAAHIPDDIAPGTDRYDAAICAIIGLVFLGAGPRLGLPELIRPPAQMPRREGWIYTFPPDGG